MSIERILIVDNDPVVRNFLEETMRRLHLDASIVENGVKAIEFLEHSSCDLIITDMRMPGGVSGMDLMHKAKELYPSIVVVIITAFGSIENTVEAMRAGAFYYLVKPFTSEVIEAVIDKAKEHISLVEENQYLRHQVSSGGSRMTRKVIGESPAMKQILSEVEVISKSNASVFITGESGTGKEVIAHAIHFSSLRAQKPFIKVNCAAMPENLIESEFFGHEKGSFTGAISKRIGRFELAHGGSLLLDEVTEIPINLQSKLLRAVQEQEFERIGGTKPVAVDVRLISTSNRNVKEAVVNKILREDLYYRLNVVPIHLPPLRERQEDIIPLAEYFLERFCLDNSKKQKQLTPSAKEKLIRYSWPGNIRELANILERAVVLDLAAVIDADHLPLEGVRATQRKRTKKTKET